jgi:hypothetical protein
MSTTKRELVTGNQRTIKKIETASRLFFLLNFAVFTNKYKVNALKTFQTLRIKKYSDDHDSNDRYITKSDPSWRLMCVYCRSRMRRLRDQRRHI